MITQGDVWWADLGQPIGSAPGFRRPVVVVQNDSFNRSRIGTCVVVPLTSNMRWADAPGNVALAAADTSLPKDSVANVSQSFTVDRSQLIEPVCQLPETKLELILNGLDVLLGR